MARTRGSKNNDIQYRPRAFETKHPDKKPRYERLFFDMLESPAWQALSNNSKVLYIFMKMQFSATDNNGLPEQQFVFNKALYTKRYNLYSNQAQFYKDRDMLVAYGFIRIAESGRFTRTKNIYEFSSAWQSVDVKEVKEKMKQKHER